jgi:hypothetical protein
VPPRLRPHNEEERKVITKAAYGSRASSGRGCPGSVELAISGVVSTSRGTEGSFDFPPWRRECRVGLVRYWSAMRLTWCILAWSPQNRADGFMADAAVGRQLTERLRSGSIANVLFLLRGESTRPRREIGISAGTPDMTTYRCLSDHNGPLWQNAIVRAIPVASA